MNRHGFTLVEMLVVVALIGIALAIAIPQYGVMQRRSQVASQTREIYAEINAFRLSAMYNKQRRAIILNPRTMEFRRYANDAVALLAPVDAVNVFTLSTKPLNNEIRYGANLAVPFNNATIAFDQRGNSTNSAGDNLFAIVVLPVDVNGGDGCVIVSELRTTIGRMTNANTCTAN